MKFFLISDNIDTLAGMRLAGIEGIVAHGREELLAALDSVIKDESVGLLLMTEKLARLAGDEIRELKLNSRRPLLVEIPDRHGGSGIAEAMKEYIDQGLGIRSQESGM